MRRLTAISLLLTCVVFLVLGRASAGGRVDPTLKGLLDQLETEEGRVRKAQMPPSVRKTLDLMYEQGAGKMPLAKFAARMGIDPSRTYGGCIAQAILFSCTPDDGTAPVDRKDVACYPTFQEADQKRCQDGQQGYVFGFTWRDKKSSPWFDYVTYVRAWRLFLNATAGGAPPHGFWDALWNPPTHYMKWSREQPSPLQGWDEKWCVQCAESCYAWGR